VRTLLLLLAGCGASIAAAPAKPERVQLPTDWAVGSEQRYRAVWTRAIDVWRGPGSPPPAMNTGQRGQIAVRVIGKAKGAYLVRWEPAISTTYPARAKGDVEAAGLELWRLSLALPLDLSVDPRSAAEPVVRNAREVHARMDGQMQAFVRELPGQATLDCQGADSTSFACQLVGDEAASSAMVLRSASPLFRCTGLDVEVSKTETWTEPHPSPEIGEAITIENRQEVVAYDARSPQLRVKTTTQPNPAQLQAWIKGKVAAMPGGDKSMVEKIVAEMSFRFETDCTMDRRSGWPEEIEFKMIGGSALYQGSDTVRFVREP
jgi:hypothetical protein